MSVEVGDKVVIHDFSWGFGVNSGEYVEHGYLQFNGTLIVKAIRLKTTANCYGKTSGEGREICDILITDDNGNFLFTQSRFVRKVIDKKNIEVKYLCNGEDVTDKISDETKRNLAP